MKTPCIRVSLVLAKYPATEGTTTYYWSSRPLADAGAWSDGRVVGIGEISRSCTDQDGNYQVSSVSIALSDDDALFRTLLDDANAQFLIGREVTIELLSEAGRAAAAAWRPLFRGVCTEAQLGRERTATIVATDILGSKFSSFDLEREIGLVLGTEHTALPDASVGRIYPIIVGEHSDLGATDINGDSAEKGLLPVIDTGDYFIDGSTDPTTSLDPPSTFTATLVGSGSGTFTRHYAIIAGNASGLSRMSAVVSVAGCPETFDGSTYVALNWSSVTGATYYLVCGRTHNPPTTWLDGMNNGGTYVSPETSYNDDNDHDIEKGLPDVSVGTAVPDGVWGRLLVSIGVTDVHDVFASDLADGTTPKRVKLGAELDGIEYLTPQSADWPHPNPYIELDGIRQTVIYVRGPRLKAHRDGSVTVAVTGCGMEDVGDGTGDLVDEAFLAAQLFLNEHVLKNGGTGYRGGDYGPLETYANGDAQLWTSQFAAAQTLSGTWVTGGYLAAWAIYEPMTVREWLRRFCVTFDCRFSVNHFGQVYPFLINPGASASSGNLYREREEGVALVDQTYAVDELENRITYSFDFDNDGGVYRSVENVIENADSIAAHVPGGVSGDTDVRGVYAKSAMELWATRDPDTAFDAMTRRLARNRRAPRYVGQEQDLAGVEEEPGAQIRFTHQDGKGASGDSATPLCVLQHVVVPYPTDRAGTRFVSLDLERAAEAFPV